MRSEKQLLKQEITGKIERFDSFVIMQYKRFKANVANAFRRELKQKSGGEFEIVRKRVLLKAAEDAGISLDLSSLPGHIGVVFLGTDPIETTKIVFKFSQENEKVFGVLGGRFEGQYYTGEDVEKLSKLPSKDEMRAQFLSTLEAPMAQTLAVMDAVLSSVVYCLDNKTKQENQEGS